MFTVAIVGPDGAGKTSVCRELEHLFPLPCRYIYMGLNPDAGNHMLPTTRLIFFLKRKRNGKSSANGWLGAAHSGSHSKATARGMTSGVKSGFSLINRIGEEWFRQFVAWNYLRRGYIVLFDRHFYSDYFAYEAGVSGGKRPFARRVHGFMLERIYPKPNLVIYLDAPARVLFARKREGTISSLERQRQGYLQMQGKVREFQVVDGNRTQDRVVSDVIQKISDFHSSRTVARRKGWRGPK